ncbi:unnamed protein product [Paramecium octaurelia]|uniref:PX domain-containing protein n=1 Tax=Paramecium octaurelia TaxID=43137 RepID=A0A8S1SIC9_PAROT|nr:unnamed protein product [Paramecium octaurelia]
MYCADNQISCTIIYALNIFGLLLVLGILFKSREFYLREWRRIRQVIKDYTIDYRSGGNFPIFAKFLGVLLGFCILILASIVSIILWDTSFGFMEISNVFLWTTCAFLFYIDYRSIFKFSKQLRLALAIILIIQFTSGLVFGIERNLEKENKGLDDLTVEASVYLCNFIIVLFINIISLFFPKFEYQKLNKNSDDNNFISINTLSHHLISDESISLQTQKQNYITNSSSQRQSISKNPKRNQSFIDQIEEGKKDDQNSLGSSSIQKLKQEQSGLIDLTYGLKKEEEAIQKEKEQKELMSQIQDMHKQLDEKLNRFKQDSEINQQEQEQSPVKDKVQKKNTQELTELSDQLNTQKQPEANANQKYEIQSIKIEGFEEIKKQGKRFIYFKIFYFSNSKQRQVRTEHNLKEFQQLRYDLSQIYVNHSFPEIPEKKPNERLTGKDVASRGEALEKFLQFIVQNQMSCPKLDKFLEETSGPVLIEDEKETNIDQVLKDKSFDDFLEIRKGSITSKQSYLDKDFNEESFEPKSSFSSSQYDQTSYFSKNPDRFQSNTSSGMGNGHKFIIKEVKTAQQITYYKIEGSINGQTVATVQRRYNDFKDLYKKLQERQYQIPILPNEPVQKQQDVIAYRQEALAQFLNALYQNKSVKTNMVFKEFVGI